MLGLTTLLNPKAYVSAIRRRVLDYVLHQHPNLRGATRFNPGNFHSPLLDIQSLASSETHLLFDGAEMWEHIDLRTLEQRTYYTDLLDSFPLLPFPKQKTTGYRYFTENDYFPHSDACLLSSIIQKEKPRRIMEIGCGFSSAVMLDTLEKMKSTAALTFIEPYPDRLYSQISVHDRSIARVIVQRVQEVPLPEFDLLEAQDVLFIDSSHVVKIGSDVAHILFRILPRLKRGVLVHFHDIFYPFTYPISWIREGIAWNESLFLRSLLVGNSQFELVAFNSYAGFTFPKIFRKRFPEFLDNFGGSLWMRKVS